MGPAWLLWSPLTLLIYWDKKVCNIQMEEQADDQYEESEKEEEPQEPQEPKEAPVCKPVNAERAIQGGKKDLFFFRFGGREVSQWLREARG